MDFDKIISPYKTSKWFMVATCEVATKNHFEVLYGLIILSKSITYKTITVESVLIGESGQFMI